MPPNYGCNGKGKKSMRQTAHWDLDYDVVVAGYGYAGGMSAIAANDDGAKTIILEKMRHFGGNSIVSGGSCVASANAGETLKYLRRMCLNTTDDGVLQAFARGLSELEGLLTRLAAEVGFQTKRERFVWLPGKERTQAEAMDESVPGGAAYPFPGAESLYTVSVSRNEAYKPFLWTTGTKAGATLFRVVHEHIKRRPIDLHLETPVKEFVTNEDGMVLGIVAEHKDQRFTVRARRAVILCTGGFEHNQRLQSHYLQIQNVVSMSPLGNTGDGILMAQKAGAALWHLWHLHGSYGFRFPDMPIAIRHAFRGYRVNSKLMAWIIVDRFGRRFMNEYPPASQDTLIRSLEYYDPDIQDYPRIPCYLIFDEEGRKLGPIGEPRSNDESFTYQRSQDNLRELEDGRIRRFGDIEALAGHLKVNADALQETIARWNKGCRLGSDPDFMRPPKTMMPVETPPFYTIAAWPIVTNTQGGPVHNARQQIVDPYGEPILRLYAAGELGSLFGHLYQLGGNNAECFVGGKIAGSNAAAEEPWC